MTFRGIEFGAAKLQGHWESGKILRMQNAEKPKIQRRKDARPAEIMDAGIKEFAAHGFERARLDRIAKAAGIAKGTIYLYYESKEALFLAAAEQHVVEVMAQGETRLADASGSTEELLVELLQSLYDRFVDGRAQTLLRVLIAEGDRIPQVVEKYHDMAIRRGTLLLQRILERGVARGEIRETAILQNPQILIAPALFFALHGMMFGQQNRLNQESYFSAHVELMLHGVLKR